MKTGKKNIFIISRLLF